MYITPNLESCNIYSQLHDIDRDIELNVTFVY